MSTTRASSCRVRGPATARPTAGAGGIRGDTRARAGGLGVGGSAGAVESVIAGQTCVAGVDEGCYGPPVPPGYVWPAGDPNTGLWVCGRLAGGGGGQPYISPG